MTSADPWTWAPAGARRLVQPVSLLRLTGPDTLRVLHGQTSQALLEARPGDCRATCCLTATARLRGLAEVVVEENGAWLVLTAGDGPALREALDRVLFPSDQVDLGPLQPGRWLRLPGQEPSSPATWRPLEGGGGWWLGNDLLLLGDTPLPPALAAVPPLGDKEAAFWRLQQGEPAWPEEINDAFNPFELGLVDRVSLSKGCYLGQETLAKLASSDGVKQQLRRWWASPGSIARLEPGVSLQSADGARAGQITSCLPWADDIWVGLAMVRKQALASPTLMALAGESAVPVRLSRPAAFRDPPTTPPSGAGRRGTLT
jgi:folate-binding protein YgfZ